MIRRVCQFVCHSKVLSTFYLNGNRRLSAQAAVSLKPTDEEYAKAFPFEQIPGLSKLQLLKRFLPGGKFYKMAMNDVQTSLRDELGDFYRLPGLFGQPTILCVFDAKANEFIFRTEGTYPFRRGLDTMNHFRRNVRSDIYSTAMGGLLVEQGEEWHKMRSLVNPILMQPKIVKAYIPLIDGIVNDFMANIQSLQDENGEMPANFREYINRWSLESIVAITLEKRLGLMDFTKESGMGDKLIKAVRRIFVVGMEFEMKPSLWKIYETKQFKELMNAYNEVTELSSTLIEEAKARIDCETHEKSGKEEGILSKLLKKDKKFATIMAFDMILAGIDTTASALVGTIYCLAKNPEKQEKLREELKQVMPSQDTPMSVENMKNLPYLRACLKESIRMFPPALGTARRTCQNLVINGYKVPKGVDVTMITMHIHKDERYFASPYEFFPERWLRNVGPEVCPRSMKQAHPFAFLPFGFGARFCVGKRIAEMELEVFLCRLFRNYKIEWNHPDLKVKALLVNILEGDHKFKFTKI